jgi:formyl-CoA transferase
VCSSDLIFAQHDWVYWKEQFDRLGITYGQVAKMEDLAGDGQLRHAGAVVPVADGFGSDCTVGTPVYVRGEEKRPAAAAPAVGEHNADILAEFGYSAAEIEAFAAAGVLK